MAMGALITAREKRITFASTKTSIMMALLVRSIAKMAFYRQKLPTTKSATTETRMTETGVRQTARYSIQTIRTALWKVRFVDINV